MCRNAASLPTAGERGHQLMLAQCRPEPLLTWACAWAKAGAALARPLLPSACAIPREMASFEAVWGVGADCGSVRICLGV